MRGSSGPKIVLTEAFSPSHIGNWALAECAVKRLKEAFPEADFTILARDKEGIERVIGEKTLEKLFPRMPHHENKLRQLLWLLPNTAWALAGLLAVVISRGDRARSGDMIRALTRGRARRDALDAIIQADLVVSIAGESINEMFSKKLPFVLYTYWLAATLGKPVLLFPQSFGPLRSALWRKMTALALSRCLMMARDIDSLGLLLDLGLPPERCPFVPDIAVTQVAIGPDEARALLEKLGFKDDGKLRIAVVPSAFVGSDDKHIEHLAGAFRLLLERYPEAQVAVAIGNRRSGICRCRDREIAEQFVRSVNHDRRIIPLMNYELSPAQIKGIFGLFDIVVSCRMHMMIFSTMAGTPTVAIATQPKIREFMKLCGQEDRALPLEDLTDRKLLQKIEETLGSSAEIRQDLQEARARLESLVAAAAADYALDALSSRPREISRSESLTCGPLSC